MKYETVQYVIGIVSYVTCIGMVAAPLLSHKKNAFSKKYVAWIVATSFVALSVFFLVTRPFTPSLNIWVQIFVTFLLGVGFYFCLKSKALHLLFPTISADQIGWMRAMVCFSLICLVVRDNNLSTLHIPKEYLFYEGPLSPLFSYFPTLFDMRSPIFLWTIQIGSFVTLAFAGLGLFTRFSVPLAAIFATFFIYVRGSYGPHFPHSGFMPLQMLYVLSFARCGDGFSLDSYRRKIQTNANHLYPWLACVAVYAFSYFCSALSKWAIHPFWATTQNMKRILLNDATGLIDHVFHSNLVPEYVRAGHPDFVFGILAYCGLLFETAGILLLFSRNGRRWVPILISLLHIGIYFGQKFAFFDLIVLPLAFLDVRDVKMFFTKKKSVAPKATRSAPYKSRHQYTVALVSAIVLGGWQFHWHVYPIATTWGMYAIASGHYRKFYYLKLTAVTESGGTFDTDLSDEINIMNMAKWQDFVRWPDPPTCEAAGPLKKLFENYAGLYNQGKAKKDQITDIDFEYWTWHYENPEENRTFGLKEDVIRFPIQGRPCYRQ